MKLAVTMSLCHIAANTGTTVHYRKDDNHLLGGKQSVKLSCSETYHMLHHVETNLIMLYCFGSIFTPITSIVISGLPF